VNTQVQWLANTSQEAKAILDRWEQLGKRRRESPKKEAAPCGKAALKSNNAGQLVARIVSKSKEIHWATFSLLADELAEWLQTEILAGTGKERK
jgi:hypothetical protein